MNVFIQSKAKVCTAVQKEIYTNVKNYCIDNNYNKNYTFKIRSNAEEETGVLLDKDGKELKEEADLELVKEGFLKNDIPYCPSNGTYKVVVTQVVGGIAKIEVTCDGSDGTHQKD